MLGDLRVTAAMALGESHDPLDASRCLAGIPFEQIVDDSAGTAIDREELDAHRPPGVVAAPHDPGLLEHPDENARVVVAGRQLGRIDGAAEVADRAVDAP